MTDTFKTTKDLIKNTLDKIILKEDDEKFVSTKNQTNNFDVSKINANIYDDSQKLDYNKEEEKNKLTSQVIEKIKQNLKVSDELQSILNRIDKLNKEITSNTWKINEKDNTAVLKDKNAYIFKQNNNLCLSHNGNIEIFKSVQELHNWLKKHNYPLPHNIKLHEGFDLDKQINDQIELLMEILYGYSNLDDYSDTKYKQDLIKFKDNLGNKDFYNTLLNDLKNIFPIVQKKKETYENLPNNANIDEKLKIFYPNNDKLYNKIINLSKDKKIQLLDTAINKNNDYIEAYNVIQKIEELNQSKSQHLNKSLSALQKDGLNTQDQTKDYWTQDRKQDQRKERNEKIIQGAADLIKQNQEQKELEQKQKQEDINYQVRALDSQINKINKEEDSEYEVPQYSYSKDDSLINRLKHAYENTPWADIISHRWKNLGKPVYDDDKEKELANNIKEYDKKIIAVQKADDISEITKGRMIRAYEMWKEKAQQALKQYIENRKEKHKFDNIYQNIRPMSYEQEKDARREGNIRQIANPFGLDGRVWTDLRTGLGDALGNEEAIQNAQETTKKLKQQERNKMKSTKKESIEDNQLNDNNIWYLEYQTNIPEESLYLNNAWKDADLLTDNLDTAAKFISRENAINELKSLYENRHTAFPFKPIVINEFEECGSACTTTGALGSAVKYLGNKKEHLNEQELDEAQRFDQRDKSKLNKELIKIANIKDFNDNVIARAGKTILEYAEANELGFDIDADTLDIIFTQGNKTFKVNEVLKNRRIALDIITDQPIGMIDNKGKVRNLRGKEIGYSDTREAAKNLGLDLNLLDTQVKADDNFQYTQKAGAQWAGKKRLDKKNPNQYEGKLGFIDLNTGEIKKDYKDIWAKLTKNNQKLRDNPMLMHIMFSDQLENGKIIDPEKFKKRVADINEVFNINLDPNVTEIRAGDIKGTPNHKEFEKWRDTWYKPLFNTSRQKNKPTDKIYADKETFNKEQDEWRTSANDRADQEQSIQYFINDMNNKTDDFVNRKIGGFELTNAFQTFINNEAIPNRLKSSMAKKIYSTIEDEQGPDMAQMFKMMNQNWFTQEESVLTEDDTPADFADGPTNINSDMTNMTAETDNMSDMSTDMSSNDLSDYAPDESNGGAPSFGDINIGSGGGMPDDSMMPPSESNEKIIDVLVNEDDPTQIKVKIKNLDTGKIETKDLSEIDV